MLARFSWILEPPWFDIMEDSREWDLDKDLPEIDL